MASSKIDIVSTNLLALELMENNRNLAAVELLASAIPPVMVGTSSTQPSPTTPRQHPLDFLQEKVGLFYSDETTQPEQAAQPQPAGSKIIDSYGSSLTTATPAQQHGYYNKAFLVTHPRTNQLKEWAEETSAAIIFNTALAFHREGIHTGQSIYFASAMRLYRETIVSIEKYSFQPNHRLGVILLAAVTNICQVVMEHYFDFACGRQLADYYKRVLEWAHMTRESEEDFTLFQLQAFMFDLAPMSPAPAA